MWLGLGPTCAVESEHSVHVGFDLQIGRVNLHYIHTRDTVLKHHSGPNYRIYSCTSRIFWM